MLYILHVHQVHHHFRIFRIELASCAFDQLLSYYRMGQWILEDEIQKPIGDCRIAAGRNITRRQRMIGAFRWLEAGEQNRIVQGAADLADTAANINGWFAVDDNAGVLIAGGAGALANNIVERKRGLAANQSSLQVAGSQSDVVAAVARIEPRSIRTKNGINIRDILI